MERKNRHIIVCSSDCNINDVVASRLSMGLRRICSDDLLIDCAKDEGCALKIFRRSSKHLDVIVVIPGPDGKFWKTVDLARHENPPVRAIIWGDDATYRKIAEGFGGIFVPKIHHDFDPVLIDEVAKTLGIAPKINGHITLPATPAVHATATI